MPKISRGQAIAFLIAGAVLLVGAIIAIAVAAANLLPMLTARPPGPGSAFVVTSESKARTAAQDEDSDDTARAAAEYLAEQPTAYWFTPERDPIDQVWGRINILLEQARAQSAVMTMVVYGIPGRDCGNYSAGGLSPEDYEAWTAAMGQALRSAPDVQKIVVLEPDSLALAPECGNVDERVEQLSGAVENLKSTNTWLYLDGGHSNWLSVDEMANLISRVSTPDVRGFATNVSNFNPLADEIAYAQALSERLGGGHALIDTSRNGNGATSEWCNPPGRLVGEPAGTAGDEIVDTNMWIKPPGESDGTCNGGPAAGEWWDRAAIELTRDVRP